MAMVSKGFFVGLSAGVALAMITMDMWALFLQDKIADSAQPRLLRPFERHGSVGLPESSEGLPEPWFPETSSHPHESWRVRPLNGGQLTLADLRGNVVFLNFWSTTCAPCIEEMRGIERLHDSLKGERVAFLAVTQEDEKEVRNFLQKHAAGVPVYLANKDVPKDLQFSGLPTTFILDSSGVAVFKHAGALNWGSENARTFIRSLAGLKSAP